MILPNGTTQCSRVLVDVIKGARLTKGVIKPVVAVHHAAIPIIVRIAMKLFGAALGAVIHLSTRQLTVLSALSVRGDRNFGHFVGPQQQVRRAAIVQVQERDVVILAAQREKFRRSG
jgi:hypothetical protein